MKQGKGCRVAAGIFVFLGVLVLIATLAAGFVYSTTKEWMPYELSFELPFAITHDYLMIGAGAMVIFFLVAAIFKGFARKAAKNAPKEPTEEELQQYFVDPAFTATFSIPAVSKKPEKETDEVGKKIVSVCCSEKGKKAAKIALPVIAAGIATATAVTMIQNGKKAKRRREFYRWLG